MKRQDFIRRVLTLPAIMISLLMCSCVSRSIPYISNDIDLKIKLVPTRCHEFLYVRAYYKGDELVLYGKLKHVHDVCKIEGHVDLAVMNGDGSIVDSMNLPVVDRGNHRKGWNGAHFRTRIAKQSSDAAAIRLSYHHPDIHKHSVMGCERCAPIEAR